MNDNNFKTDFKTRDFNPPDLASELFGVQAIEAPNNPWPAVRNERAIQPAVRPLPSTTLQSMLLKHRYIEAASVRHNLSLPLIGIAPVFEEVRIYEGLDSKWVLSPAEKDVLYQFYGGLPMPKAVRTQVDRVARTGINLRVYIGHELPAGVAETWESGQPIPLEWVQPPVPKALARRTKALDRAGTIWWQTVQKTVKTVAVIGLAATSAVIVAGTAVVAAPLALTAGLDPVIIGCYYDDSCKVEGHNIGLWYSVGQWYWSEEEV